MAFLGWDGPVVGLGFQWVVSGRANETLTEPYNVVEFYGAGSANNHSVRLPNATSPMKPGTVGIAQTSANKNQMITGIVIKGQTFYRSNGSIVAGEIIINKSSTGVLIAKGTTGNASFRTLGYALKTLTGTNASKYGVMDFNPNNTTDYD